MSSRFIRIGPDRLISVDEIKQIDCQELEAYEICVITKSGTTFQLKGQEALDVIMALKPSAVEGKRFIFARHAWAFHNLVAHPVLQILAWMGFHKLGFKIHDATVPRPISELDR